MQCVTEHTDWDPHSFRSYTYIKTPWLHCPFGLEGNSDKKFIRLLFPDEQSLVEKLLLLEKLLNIPHQLVHYYGEEPMLKVFIHRYTELYKTADKKQGFKCTRKLIGEDSTLRMLFIISDRPPYSDDEGETETEGERYIIQAVQLLLKEN